ncbi:uncharacterized protein [Macrobrachium rosenbergii]|uniref:uncharacterized protein isoform X1 n=1 Tax=Macrobrachium rosenbergii TaxID=79674 RepID=UPI0034D6C110
MMLSGYISPGTQFRIPGSTIKTTFQTDSSVTRADRSTTKKGFRLRFGKAGSGCSKFVYVTSKVKIKSPRFSKPHPANKQCEYRLKAPAGKRIHIHFRTLKTPCSSNYVAFNLDPSRFTTLYRRHKQNLLWLGLPAARILIHLQQNECVFSGQSPSHRLQVHCRCRGIKVQFLMKRCSLDIRKCVKHSYGERRNSLT